MEHHEDIKYPIHQAIAISYYDDGKGDVRLHIASELSPVKLMTAMNHAHVIMTQKLGAYMDMVVEGDCYCTQCHEVRQFWETFQKIRKQSKQN